MKLWERQPYDTLASWAAFQDYRAMAGDRSLRQLWQGYMHQSSINHSTPTKSLSTLQKWCQCHNWVERCAAWDAEQDTMRLQEEQERSRREHRDKIESFRSSHEQVGKGSYQAVILATRLVKRHLETVQSLDTTEAIQLMKAIATLGQYASEQWAKSIGVDRLLDDLDNTGN